MTDALITESLSLTGSGSTVAQRQVARGESATWLLTLEGAGSIAGATLSANVRMRGSQQVLVAPTPTISDAANRIIDLTLASADTLLLVGSAGDPLQNVRHVCDVTMVLGGVTGTFGPLLFDVRTPA